MYYCVVTVPEVTVLQHQLSLWAACWPSAPGDCRCYASCAHSAHAIAPLEAGVYFLHLQRSRLSESQLQVGNGHGIYTQGLQ